MLWNFDDLELDGSRRELRRGGERIPVEPRVFDLLVYLIENRDRLVSKDDLIANVWSGRIVSESALVSAINAARKAIGDSGQEQRLIRTSARKGIRFVGEVEQTNLAGSDMSAPALPATRYAQSGKVNIAYQVMGNGPVDLILVPGMISHIEYQHELPGFTDTLRLLSTFCRVVTFDKRGQGLSDRVTDAATLEERIDDIRAVMDALPTRRAFIMGFSDGGAWAAVFSAIHPERVRGLIAFGSYLRGRFRDPVAMERWVADRTRHWGSGAFMKNVASFHQPLEPKLAERFGKMERLAASPGSLRATLEFNNLIDVSSVLGAVKVPTLVLQRLGDAISPADGARKFAAAIPGARWIEYPGGDHAFWTGDVAGPVADIRAFTLSQLDEAPQVNRVLATVLSVDADGRIHANGEHKALVEQHRGTLIAASDNSLLATFDGPSRGVHCALELAEVAKKSGRFLRAGLHVAEIDPASRSADGTAFDVARQVMSRSQGGDVLVSRVVADLIAGTGLKCVDRGACGLDGIPGNWELYAVGR